jgi:hypothetical protein
MWTFRALRFATFVKLPDASLESFLFSGKISLIRNHKMFVRGTILREWLVIRKQGPDEWPEYPAKEQPGQNQLPRSDVEGRGAMRHHLRDIHFAPLALSGGVQLVNA